MRNLLFMVAVAAVPLFAPARAAECPDSRVDLGKLPHTADALARSGEITIVAFGSSSTQGWMSSDAAHTYPAILQQALSEALPRAHVAVVNRGIGGQDAAEELPRIDGDVLALRPSLVIWQVGANGALRNIDPDLFRRLVTSGIERMQAAGADVLLMDNQRAPMIMASLEHARIDQILSDVATEKQAALFQRGALMASWERDGQPPDRFLANDGLHHNDLGYRCVALALAQGIAAGIRPVTAPVMTSSVQPPPPPRGPAR